MATLKPINFYIVVIISESVYGCHHHLCGWITFLGKCDMMFSDVYVNKCLCVWKIVWLCIKYIFALC